MTDQDSLEASFQDALVRVKKLSKQPNEILLELYGLFKQAQDGDVNGKRPGMLDIRGRAKYDAWSKNKGMNQEEAKRAYIDAVERLERQES